MSRRTPPANKSTEDKPGGVGGGGTGGSGGGVPGGGGGGGPGSPRVTLRLPNTTVTRTPEKPRPHDTKPLMENSEDVYEFKCSKDEGRGEEEEDKTAAPPRTEPGPTEDKGDKRAREAEAEEDEEARKKRRKEEIKEGPKGVGRGAGRPIGAPDKTIKSGGRGNSGNTSGVGLMKQTVVASGSNSIGSSGSVGNSLSGERKSPMGSAANSPKPPSTKTGGESSDTEDDVKSESSSGAGPKVPPLKIVLGGGAEQEPNTRNGKSSSSRHLPYVVNTSSGEEKEGQPDTKEPGQPPKTEEQGVGNNNSNSNSNNSNGNSNNSSNNSTNNNNSNTSSTTNNNNSSNNNNNNNNNGSNGNSSSGSEKGSGTRITRSQRGGNSSSNDESTSAASTSVVKTEPCVSTSVSATVKVEESARPPQPTMEEAVHPRKRKIKMKAEPEAEPPPVSLVDQPMSNCYETFLNIRKQIERRRENLRPVQPKPPQGFKDYLMNRCSYVLAGNANSRLSVPIMSPPATLSQLLKDLFADQEKERYRLRLQHLIEKEKLVLSVEQEILRVHGRAARALANQALPFSVCTFLKDEEVYNIISPEQQDKDSNARSRYNGRLFLSWLQDVDDKWDKIKEFMVLRHHNEAESLHAVQRMDWEWKLKELGDCDANSRPQIDELHVPMVHVSDDFDLLPE